MEVGPLSRLGELGRGKRSFQSSLPSALLLQTGGLGVGNVPQVHRCHLTSVLGGQLQSSQWGCASGGKFHTRPRLAVGGNAPPIPLLAVVKDTLYVKWEKPLGI